MVTSETILKNALIIVTMEGFSRFKLTSEPLREFLAELLGTFILVLFGDASVAQVILSNNLGIPHGDFFSINWGWGIGVTMAVLVVGGASGGHINPAVTLALAVVGKFPWRKVAHYMAGQYLGAFLGAALVYAVYYQALMALGPVGLPTHAVNTTAGIFATYPQEYLNLGSGFLDQVVGTALLLLVVSAIGDRRNLAVPAYLSPLLVGLAVLNIGVCFGLNCGYAINPARDLAPRLFTALAGWGGDVFKANNWWFWVPVLAPHLGGIVGAGVYMLMVERHWPRPATTTTKEGEEKTSNEYGKIESSPCA